jgi:hypothetical protein
VPRVTPKPKVAGFCAALWLDFTPALTRCVLRTQSMAMILASFAAMRFSSSLFIARE